MLEVTPLNAKPSLSGGTVASDVRLLRFLQLLNAYELIFVKLAGKVNVVKPVHELNTLAPKRFKPSLRVTEASAVHDSKALAPISVTLAGISISDSFEHRLNASLPILVTPSGMVMVVNDSKLAKE